MIRVERKLAPAPMEWVQTASPPRGRAQTTPSRSAVGPIPVGQPAPASLAARFDPNAATTSSFPSPTHGAVGVGGVRPRSGIPPLGSMTALPALIPVAPPALPFPPVPMPPATFSAEVTRGRVATAPAQSMAPPAPNAAPPSPPRRSSLGRKSPTPAPPPPGPPPAPFVAAPASESVARPPAVRTHFPQ